MIRLVDGACAVLGLPGQPSRVVRADGDYEVPDEHRAALTRVAQGLARDDDLDDDGVAFLIERNLAGAGLSAVDPQARARLRALGEPYAWRLEGHVDGPLDGPLASGLLRQVRDLHARRKLFVAYYGQTSCLPECALARIHLLMQRVPPPARVLLIGDDDFLSVPLALLGYDVTVFDIDEDLVRYLGQAAADHGVTVDLRMLDLLQPLPPDVLGAFDAVLTDPMSHVNCFTVFLGRGLAALTPGRPLFTCVHAMGRTALHQVLADLPAHVVAWHKGVSAYYISGFAEIHYRSDFVELQRTALDGSEGALPVPGDVPMPAIDVTAEDLPWPAHGLGYLKGVRFAARGPVEPAAFVAWLQQERGLAVSAIDTFEDGPRLHLRLALPGGRRAQLVFDRRKLTVYFHLYPHDDDEGWALVHAARSFLGTQTDAFLDPYANAFTGWLPSWPG